MKRLDARPYSDLPAFLTVRETARVLRIGHSQVRNLIHEGRIPYVRMGSSSNGPILVPIEGLKKALDTATGLNLDLEPTILSVINSPDEAHLRDRREGIEYKRLLLSHNNPLMHGRGFLEAGQDTITELNLLQSPDLENSMLEYAKLFNLFVSYAVELVRIRQQATRRAIDLLEKTDEDKKKVTANLPDTIDYIKIRSAFEKTGRKVSALYTRFPKEVKSALKNPAEVKRSIETNLRYCEDLTENQELKPAIRNRSQNREACEKVLSGLIQNGYFNVQRKFREVVGEVEKIDLSLSGRTIRNTLKTKVQTGYLAVTGSGTGTQYSKC